MSRLIWSLLAIVYFETASRIVLALVAASLKVFPETKMLVSSAKRTKHDRSEHLIKSLIDSVYSNMISKVVTSSVITIDLTDHLATTATVSLDSNFDNSTWRNCGKMYSNNDNMREYRMFNEANENLIKSILKKSLSGAQNKKFGQLV